MRIRNADWAQPKERARRLKLELLATGEAPRLSMVLRGIRNDLKMARRGADLGAMESPPSNSIAPCDAEVQARFYCRVLLDEGDGYAWSGLEKQRALIAANAILPKDDSFVRLTSGLRSSVRGILTEAVADLQPLKEARNVAKVQMNWFRQRNKLPEDCKCDASIWPWIGWMAACVALDALPTAPAFGDGDPLGMVGGWLGAVAMSSTTVFSGIITAFGRRSLRRGTILSSSSGILAMAAALGWAAFMALLATHYRHALLVDPTNAMQMAATTIQISLLPPSIDIKSSSLLSVSAASTLIAYHKTMTSWGEYPGYRNKKIALDEATQALRELWNSVRDQLEDLRREVVNAIDEQVERVRRKVAQAKSAYIAAGLIIDRHNSWSRAVRDAYEAAIISFREANLAVRLTPAPLSFNKQPHLDVKSLDLRAQLADALKDIDSGFSGLVQRAERAKDDADKIIDEALRQLGIWGPDDSAPDGGGVAPASPLLPQGAS